LPNKLAYFALFDDESTRSHAPVPGTSFKPMRTQLISRSPYKIDLDIEAEPISKRSGLVIQQEQS